MTELNKFGVIGLLHFHKGILPFYVVENPFQKLQYVYKDPFYYIRKKDWYTDAKKDDKESVLFFLHKNSELFYP